MVNPTLTRKEENSLSVAENTKKLFQVIYREQSKKEKSDDEEIPKIKVSTVISKMAFYYEKIRNSVDYKEEHLLQKNAIERILKRQIIIEGTLKELGSDKIAKHLLAELIRAGYLPNNKIPEGKINEISTVINKYLKLRQYSLKYLSSQKEKEKGNDKRSKTEFINWIIAIMASDIEGRLGQSTVSQMVISNMYEILVSNIKLPKDSLLEKDKDIQVYISVYRNYLKFDRDMLGFILFKYFNTNWDKASNEDIERIAKDIKVLKSAVDKQIDHPLARQLNLIINRYTVFFSILTDVIKEDPTGVYDSFKSDPKAFPRAIKRVCQKQYKLAKTKLWRAAVRSIIYIFVTKSFFAVFLEVPATKWFGEEINPLSLAINISFPAFLLFLVVLFTRLPSEDNTNKIVTGIGEIAFLDLERKEPYRLSKPVQRSKLMNTIFGVMYTITFFLSFGFVIWGLNKINFSFVSIVIFLFFLAFVSFFGIRIRKSAHELIVVEPKENILSFFVDFFYVPIVAVGKWLSEKFSHINVFVFILDFIIEAPFKIFVEIAEDWTKYVRERKEEIV